jgi:FtsH-binding integral membrane protein
MGQAYSTRAGVAHPKFRDVGLPAAALIGLNVLLMAVVAMTPLAAINDLLFGIAPIVGLLVFGAALTGGNYLAEKGLESGDMGTAYAGIALLQAAYGVFGGGIVATVGSQSARAMLLGVTLAITVAMTVGIAAYVYVRDREFSHWNRWSLIAFVVGAVLVLVGTFVTPVLIGGFLLIFAGFTLRLGYEIWRVRDGYRGDQPLVHSLGIYVAFTGVFVHVLQIVRQFVANR